MALERDPQTRIKAALLRKGAGRGSISEHGATMAVELLEANGFQIWEVTPDKPAEPTYPPNPELRYGSLDSLNVKYDQLRDLEYKCDQLRKEWRDEVQDAIREVRPVFQAIRMAIDETKEQ